MAAVICYLSADNHIADTPPFNGPESGLRRATVRLFHSSSLKRVCVSVCFTFLYIRY